MIETGEQLNELIASLGFFAMNNQRLIIKAFRNDEMGKMGVLTEKSKSLFLNPKNNKQWQLTKIDAPHPDITFKVKHLMISFTTSNF